MEIRKTVMGDLDRVMEIYDDARKHMRENGNTNQWVDGYPYVELINQDIIDENSYVCVDDNRIVGVFYYSIGPDATYLKIYEGSWVNNDSYSVIHRIASGSRQKGVASFCLDWCFNKWPNIRIDTHRDNTIMQKFLKKNKFSRCGIIYLEDGAERIAYQKVI